MEKIMNKLVRDNIPDIIQKNGDIPSYRILNDNEYVRCLKEKIFEEYHEILDAQTKEETLEECADLLELLFALSKFNGYCEEDLLNARVSKREKRGGFDKKIYLEKTINKKET